MESSNELKDVVMTDAGPLSLPNTLDGLIKEWDNLRRSNKLDEQRYGQINADVKRAEKLLTAIIKLYEDNQVILPNEYLEDRAKIRQRLAAYGCESWALKAVKDWEHYASFQNQKVSVYHFALSQASFLLEDFFLFYESAQLWRNYVKNYPCDIRGYKSLGFSLKRISAYEEELTVRNKIIELQPNDWISYSERSAVYFAMNQVKEGLADTLHSVTMVRDKQSKEILLFRGVAYLKSGNYCASLSDLDYLLSKFPDHRIALFDRATCYQQLGISDKALQGFRSILRLGRVLNTTNADSAWNCGIITMSEFDKQNIDKENITNSNLNKVRDAIDYFRMARALYDDDDMKSQNMCTQKIETVLKLVKQNDTPLPRRNDRLTFPNKDNERAKEIEEMWTFLNKLHAAAGNGVKQRQRNAKRIIELASRLIDLDPFGRYLYYVMRAEGNQILCDNHQDYENPIEDLQFVLDHFAEKDFVSPYLNETRAGIMLLIGFHLRELGNKKDAIRYFTLAIAEADELDRARFSRGLSYICQSAIDQQKYHQKDEEKDQKRQHMPCFPILTYFAREKALIARISSLHPINDRPAVEHDRARLIEIFPNDAQSYISRAKYFNYTRQSDKAESDYYKATQIMKLDKQWWDSLVKKEKEEKQRAGQTWYAPNATYEQIRQTEWNYFISLQFINNRRPDSQKSDGRRRSPSPSYHGQGRRNRSPSPYRDAHRDRHYRHQSRKKSPSPDRRKERRKDDNEKKADNIPKVNWTVSQVKTWISGLGLKYKDYVSYIEANHIDGFALQWLSMQRDTDRQLQKIGINNILHVNIIMRHIRNAFGDT